MKKTLQNVAVDNVFLFERVLLIRVRVCLNVSLSVCAFVSACVLMLFSTLFTLLY